MENKPYAAGFIEKFGVGSCVIHYRISRISKLLKKKLKPNDLLLSEF